MKSILNIKVALGALLGLGVMVKVTHAADPELSCTRFDVTTNALGPTPTGETSAPSLVQPKARGHLSLFGVNSNSYGPSKYRFRYEIPDFSRNLSWSNKFPNKVCDSKGVCQPSFNTTHVAVVVYRNPTALEGGGTLAAFSPLSSDRIVERKVYEFQSDSPLEVTGGAVVAAPTLPVGGDWSVIVQHIQRSSIQISMSPLTGTPVYVTSDVVMNASSCTLLPTAIFQVPPQQSQVQPQPSQVKP